jgi:hypothetical protein
MDHCDFVLTRIDDVLDALQGAKVFSGFDMLSGYWQIELEEKDKPKTAFITIHLLVEVTLVILLLPFDGRV